MKASGKSAAKERGCGLWMNALVVKTNKPRGLYATSAMLNCQSTPYEMFVGMFGVSTNTTKQFVLKFVSNNSSHLDSFQKCLYYDNHA